MGVTTRRCCRRRTGRTRREHPDPFDLTAIEVRHRGQSFRQAAPFTIGRHAHPKAKPEQPGPAPEPTGISYLNLISATHDTQLGERINYTALLAGDAGQLPGQMTIDDVLGEQQ
jgi:putative transposase